MTKIIEGKLTAKGKKFGVVISRFNELISSQLLIGCAGLPYKARMQNGRYNRCVGSRFF